MVFSIRFRTFLSAEIWPSSILDSHARVRPSGRATSSSANPAAILFFLRSFSSIKKCRATGSATSAIQFSIKTFSGNTQPPQTKRRFPWAPLREVYRRHFRPSPRTALLNPNNPRGVGQSFFAILSKTKNQLDKLRRPLWTAALPRLRIPRQRASLYVGRPRFFSDLRQNPTSALPRPSCGRSVIGNQNPSQGVSPSRYDRLAACNPVTHARRSRRLLLAVRLL
jgi:hypothetical protein